MTDKEQIERITKLLNELSLDDITSTEFDETFPKQSISELKDALWRLYCFASDVCDTINMGDMTEQEPQIWHWEFEKTVFDRYGLTVRCPSCHKKWKTYDEIRWAKENKYCPNCGAKMESEANE